MPSDHPPASWFRKTTRAVFARLRAHAPFLLTALALVSFYSQLDVLHLASYPLILALVCFLPNPFHFPSSGLETTCRSSLAFYELTVRRTSAGGAALLGIIASLAAGVLSAAPQTANAVILTTIVAGVWLAVTRFLAERNALLVNDHLHRDGTDPEGPSPPVTAVNPFIEASYNTTVLLAVTLMVGLLQGDPPPTDRTASDPSASPTSPSSLPPPAPSPAPTLLNP